MNKETLKSITNLVLLMLTCPLILSAFSALIDQGDYSDDEEYDDEEYDNDKLNKDESKLPVIKIENTEDEKKDVKIDKVKKDANVSKQRMEISVVDDGGYNIVDRTMSAIEESTSYSYCARKIIDKFSVKLVGYDEYNYPVYKVKISLIDED